jgi:plastocyanin
VNLRLVAAVTTLVSVATSGLSIAAPPDDPTTVDVVDSAFEPAEVTIKVGETVVRMQRGGLPHSVTADDGSFDSHPNCPPACMSPGQQYPRTFTQPGTFRYYCKVHGGPGGSGMAGVVTVEPPVVFRPTTVDALAASASETTLAVSGQASFFGEAPNTVTEDPSGDAPIVGDLGDETGADLVKATIYQPDATKPELWFDWHLAALPPIGALPEVVRYTAAFRIGTKQYQLQANLTNWTSVTLVDDPAGSVRGPGHFRLRGNCTTNWNGTIIANCPLISWLTGEFLPDQSIVRVKVPLGVTPDFAPGAQLTRNESTNANLTKVIAGYQAFVALSPTTNDEADWGAEEPFTYTVPTRTVRLGIVPAGAAPQFPTPGTVATDGSFSGALSTAGLPAGSYDVWARACFGTNCGTRSVRITI